MRGWYDGRLFGHEQGERAGAVAGIRGDGFLEERGFGPIRAQLAPWIKGRFAGKAPSGRRTTLGFRAE